MSVVLLILAALLALAVAGFCAGAETGFLSVNRARVLHLAREGGKKAQIVQRALADLPRTTITLLIGNNLASVGYSCSTAALSSILFAAGGIASFVWSFLAAFTVLYVSEFMPKLLCAARPLRRILYLASTYRVFEVILRPLAWTALRLTDIFLPRGETQHPMTAADLVRILQDRKDGVCLSDIESALIARIVVHIKKGTSVTPEALLDALREE